VHVAAARLVFDTNDVKPFHWIVVLPMPDFNVPVIEIFGTCTASDDTGPVTLIARSLPLTVYDPERLPPVNVTASTDATSFGIGRCIVASLTVTVMGSAGKLETTSIVSCVPSVTGS